VPGPEPAGELAQVSLAKYLLKVQAWSSEGNFAALFYFLFFFYTMLFVISASAFDELR
jgi:hypothetical protein